MVALRLIYLIEKPRLWFGVCVSFCCVTHYSRNTHTNYVMYFICGEILILLKLRQNDIDHHWQCLSDLRLKAV